MSSIYPKFQRVLYNMFLVKKCKVEQKGVKEPPYESNHTEGNVLIILYYFYDIIILGNI